MICLVGQHRYTIDSEGLLHQVENEEHRDESPLNSVSPTLSVRRNSLSYIDLPQNLLPLLIRKRRKELGVLDTQHATIGVGNLLMYDGLLLKVVMRSLRRRRK